MLYSKNNTEKLDMKLFKNPTSEYRATPFWAWNCQLDKDVLMRQIEYFKQMGFGGFHIHTRSGMATEYLSEEFFALVKACRDKAKEEDMLTWLYDEDRWSSGAAGGYVTKIKEYRHKKLYFSENKVDFADKERGVKEGIPYLAAVFDIVLDSDGILKSYKRIDKNDKPVGIKRYAYVAVSKTRGWYNGQTYIDALSYEAVREFIKVTHEAYKDHVGEDFGGNIPAIFTDEPHFNTDDGKDCLDFALSHNDLIVPWTTDFDKDFEKVYGYNILDRLPELFWELPNGEKSAVRWHYYDYLSDRFAESFSGQIGKWCEENGIALSGHLQSEDNLHWQSISVGDAMRSYPNFGIPGIDTLCNTVNFTTLKQAQSIVNQCAKEAMLSELYGVTDWDFDFRGHKFQGDWQAALGITVRVPHLSWVSMKGSAKRDYPASISYQSPWYKEYPYIENHFARLNTVLTRGKPVVKVGMIHPIESFWINFGPTDQTFEERKQLEANFQNIAKWLLNGMVDFDYINEALLPSQHGGQGDEFDVGEMNYSTVIVPGLETMRRTTFEALKKFSKKGGKILFVGKCPKYVDAVRSEEVESLYDSSLRADFDKNDILNKLDKDVEIFLPDGTSPTNIIHTEREDGDVKWLFFAHSEADPTPDIQTSEKMTIVLKGSFIPKVFDTLSGDVKDIDFETKDGKTCIYTVLRSCDSLLLRLEAGEGAYFSEKENNARLLGIIDFKNSVERKLEEDNVYLLDMAEYKLDDGEYQPLEEMVIIDDKCRKILNYQPADGFETQPWVLGEDKIEHYVTLRFDVESEVEIENVFIAAEEAEKIIFNGSEIERESCGYFVDESIKKYPLGGLKKGNNVIEITAPISERTSLENLFLLGDFDVNVRGAKKKITEADNSICFGDITNQGLPFYGGNVIYKTEIETPEASLNIRASRYRGAAIKVYLDGAEVGMIAFKPYTLKIDNVAKGKHTLEFKLLGNRYNTFGALHNCNYRTWFGPEMWYSYSPKKYPNSDDSVLYKNEDIPVYSAEWCYEYNLKATGILSSPVIEVIKEM